MKLRYAILCAFALLTGNVAFAGLLDDVRTAAIRFRSWRRAGTA